LISGIVPSWFVVGAQRGPLLLELAVIGRGERMMMVQAHPSALHLGLLGR
jgi:hypothetical protein